MTEKFRPSNASQGHAFEAAWCGSCGMRDENDGCPILYATMALQEEDPDYPSEWTYADNGAPICTSHQPGAALAQGGGNGR